MSKWIEAFHSVKREKCVDATSNGASHLAATETLPDIIWGDTRVINSSAKLCLCFKKKRED